MTLGYQRERIVRVRKVRHAYYSRAGAPAFKFRVLRTDELNCKAETLKSREAKEAIFRDKTLLTHGDRDVIIA